MNKYHLNQGFLSVKSISQITKIGVLTFFLVPIFLYSDANGYQAEMKEGELTGYAGFLLETLIIVAVLLAIIFIMIGGVLYITTDTIEGKDKGKETVTRAILGLLIALISWLILYTINPELVGSFDMLN
ncbi:MAG: hypothetical protein ACLFNR_02070 [Candidatus Paceibacterota bacterium]